LLIDPKRETIVLTFLQRTVSVENFDASKVFELQLSYPTLNEDACFCLMMQRMHLLHRRADHYVLVISTQVIDAKRHTKLG
jgi:hypothetical protein